MRINIKTLKEIIKDLPDDIEITFGNDDSRYHIQNVNKAELLHCDHEEHDCLCFSWDGDFSSDYSYKTVWPKVEADMDEWNKNERSDHEST